MISRVKEENETFVSEIIALAHKVYNTDEYLKKEGTEISELEKSIKDLELEESQAFNPSDRRKLYSGQKQAKLRKEIKGIKRSKGGKSQMQHNSCQADDVSATGSAASAFVSPLKKQLRVSDWLTVRPNQHLRSRQSLV